MNRIRMVTFDVNNTLIKVRGSTGEHYSKIAKQYGVDISAQKLTNVFNQVWQRHWSRHPNFGYGDGYISSKQWWIQLVQLCFLSCGYRGKYSTLNSISTDLYYYFYRSEAWSLYPETCTILEKLKDHNLRLGVISNFDKRLEQILDVLELAKYFDFVVTSEGAGVCKPHKHIYKKALEQGNCLPGESLHVGDSVEKDYLGPRKVGMNAVILYKGDMTQLPLKYNVVDGKHLIPTLNSLLKFII